MRLTIIALAACLSAQAQMQNNQDRQMNCDHGNRSRDGKMVSHCEIKEQTIPAAGRVNVDGGRNGGVSVKGWLRNDVLVRARIETGAPSEGEARAMVSQINVSGAGGQIRADGPEFGNDRSWAVSYEIFVPQNSDVSVKVHNGGVAIADVRGTIEFDALNGGASLKRLAGAVRGKTVNGGLSVELMGDRWEGAEFNASTTNGGVSMLMPANYSARLETSTVNGNISVDFPVSVQGKIGRELAMSLGSGGPLVRAVTTNGGVHIKRKS